MFKDYYYLSSVNDKLVNHFKTSIKLEKVNLSLILVLMMDLLKPLRIWVLNVWV